MEHKTDTLKVKGLPDIYYQVNQPDNNIKAIMLIIHGLGEHGGRYNSSFNNYYTQAGLATIAPDLPGHGKSGGNRGHIADPVLFLDIIDHMLLMIKELYPNKAVFIYGHSMGGQIVLWHTLARTPQVNGIIVSSPSICTKDPVSPFKIFMAKTMDKIMPEFSMDNDIDVNLLSRDKKIIQAYVSDPLVHNKISARLGMMILSQGQWILKHAPENKNAMLVMIGTGEGIVNKQSVDQFCEKAPLTDFKVWPDLYHEIHNEPEKNAVYTHTLSWINQHIN